MFTSESSARGRYRKSFSTRQHTPCPGGHWRLSPLSPRAHRRRLRRPRAGGAVVRAAARRRPRRRSRKKVAPGGFGGPPPGRVRRSAACTGRRSDAAARCRRPSSAPRAVATPCATRIARSRLKRRAAARWRFGGRRPVVGRGHAPPPGGGFGAWPPAAALGPARVGARAVQVPKGRKGLPAPSGAGAASGRAEAETSRGDVPRKGLGGGGGGSGGGGAPGGGPGGSATAGGGPAAGRAARNAAHAGALAAAVVHPARRRRRRRRGALARRGVAAEESAASAAARAVGGGSSELEKPGRRRRRRRREPAHLRARTCAPRVVERGRWRWRRLSRGGGGARRARGAGAGGGGGGGGGGDSPNGCVFPQQAEARSRRRQTGWLLARRARATEPPSPNASARGVDLGTAKDRVALGTLPVAAARRRLVFFRGELPVARRGAHTRGATRARRRSRAAPARRDRRAALLLARGAGGRGRLSRSSGGGAAVAEASQSIHAAKSRRSCWRNTGTGAPGRL